jgi:hypothetical protein
MYISIDPLLKYGRPWKLSHADMQSIDNAMGNDDETTGKELVVLLERKRSVRI